MRHCRFGAWLAAGLTLHGAPLRAAPPSDVQDQPHPARVRLVTESSGIAPGQTARLGVHFDIDDHWHVYSNLWCDTGLPVHIALDLPEGWTAGEIRWPTPRRYLAEGGLLDHVYEHRVTLVIPVTAPSSASPGTTARIAARVEWLVCKDACIPGEADLSLDLPLVPDGPAPSPDAPLFAAADAAIPAPLPEGVARFAHEPDAIRIDVPGAARAAFYPTRNGLTPADPIADAAPDGPSLRLRFDPAELAAPGAVLRGVLEVWPRGATPVARAYAVEFPIPTSTPAPAPTRPGG